MLHNRFRHQTYASPEETPSPAARQIVAPPPISPTQWDAAERAAVRERFEPFRLDAIYLVHGTFAGEDETGILRELHRVSPYLARRLRRERKEWFDQFAHDSGNYTEEFATQLSQLTSSVERPLPVRRFAWSGENHHLGRAEGAVLLLHELLLAAERGERRLMLWGHSHAGNVFALMTNLLSDEREAALRFFEATRRFAPANDQSLPTAAEWARVRRALLEEDLLRTIRLKLVTFGTPVRYGWETSGYESLLHLIHHRPADGFPADRAPFPFTLEDLRLARHGDYIQQLGIAGTNFVPFVFSWRNWVTERRLSLLLQGGQRRFAPPPFPLGVRVPDEGRTLLVDYPDDERHLRRELFGHAVYTRPEFLLFHAAMVAQSEEERAAGEPSGLASRSVRFVPT